MVFHCVAKLCGATYSAKEKRSFHSFPHPEKESDLYEKWLKAVNRGTFWKPNKFAKLCSDHFLPTDFIPSRLFNNAEDDPDPPKILNDGAVPSLFPFKKATVKKIPLCNTMQLDPELWRQLQKQYEESVENINKIEKILEEQCSQQQQQQQSADQTNETSSEVQTSSDDNESLKATDSTEDENTLIWWLKNKLKRLEDQNKTLQDEKTALCKINDKKVESLKKEINAAINEQKKIRQQVEDLSKDKLNISDEVDLLRNEKFLLHQQIVGLTLERDQFRELWERLKANVDKEQETTDRLEGEVVPIEIAPIGLQADREDDSAVDESKRIAVKRPSSSEEDRESSVGREGISKLLKHDPDLEMNVWEIKPESADGPTANAGTSFLDVGEIKEETDEMDAGNSQTYDGQYVKIEPLVISETNPAGMPPRVLMAAKEASSTNRFIDASDDMLAELANNVSSKGTAKATKWGVKIFTDWLVSTGRDCQFEQLPSPDLSALLRQFYGSVRSSKQKAYSMSGMTGMRSAIQRHITSPPHNRSINIISDGDFIPANQVFQGNKKKLKQEGRDIGRHKQGILEVDMAKILEISTDNPTGLQQRVFVNVMLYFAKQGNRAMLRELERESLVFLTDVNGRKYVTIHNDTTKRKKGKPECRMYATGDHNCPLAILQKYLSKLNPKCIFFFQRPSKSYLGRQCWYDNVVLGINKLGLIMVEISKGADLEKIYTNRCLRATSATFLSTWGDHKAMNQ